MPGKPPEVRHAVTQPLDKPYRLIPLTQGQNAIVDVEDFDRVSALAWHACRARYAGTVVFYARRIVQKNFVRTTIHLHQFVLRCHKAVDHINHNPLDNRKSNLRPCTSKQNAGNTRFSIRRKKADSGYLGVDFFKFATNGYTFRRKPWRVRIGGKFLGFFATAKEAAFAYDAEAKKQRGEYTELNFQSIPRNP
jgi:hypothetical protein